MEIYPAIDLIGGGCVRLTEGDFNARKNYDATPLAVAKSYEEAGAKWLHLVDLDGARDSKARQTALIAEIAKNTQLKIQTGGGVRSMDDVEQLLDLGARRVIIGSLCVKNPEATCSILEKFGKEKIVLALDVRGDFDNGFFIATAGWQENSNTRIESSLTQYNGLAEQILCTDISKDGKLKGANTDLYRHLVQTAPQFKFQASGGISELRDIDAVKESCAAALVIGKALFERKFTLREALERAV
jgi:phosphoribosylformimino-5-aminoimidazole carboxamide ribotide isomerase